MFKSQKNVFWEALLVTIFIFGVGVLAGFFLENLRANQINDLFQQSEVDLLDMRLQNEIYSSLEFDCDIAIEENLNFADRIYEEAQILEKYTQASRLGEDIILQHKKYDLLRIMLLLNSEKISEKCSDSYNEIAYFYNLETEELTIKAKENVFSKTLLEVKENYGGNVLLVPVGVSDGISSINLILDRYNISKQDLPVIIINQKTKLIDVESVEDVTSYLN
jgi:hypothetical protein